MSLIVRCALRPCTILSICFVCAVSAAASPVRTVDPCVAVGPTLPQTLLYLHGSDGKGSQFSYGEQFSYDPIQGTLTLSSTHRLLGSPSYQHQTAAVLSLDCHTSSYETPDDSESGFSMSCLDKVECFVGGDDQGVRKYRYTRGMIYMPTNPDQADLYARALSHLIVLVQEDFKQRHSTNPNDPFAKP